MNSFKLLVLLVVVLLVQLVEVGSVAIRDSRIGEEDVNPTHVHRKANPSNEESVEREDADQPDSVISDHESNRHSLKTNYRLKKIWAPTEIVWSPNGYNGNVRSRQLSFPDE
uniref:Uncharacterized protein n=1 Tax=Caenorhabditis japonica TaxID=281687 RepID=A0A8R1DHC2_CAEJA